MISIYALINPINDNVFYIGASKSPPVRFVNHVSTNRGWASSNKKGLEIKEIYDNGMELEMLILEECDIKDASFWEEFYMDLFSSFGFNLFQKRFSRYSETFLKKAAKLPPKPFEYFNEIFAKHKTQEELIKLGWI